MYEKFFGFQRAPFELVPDPDFLFLGESHDSALANLVIGIDSGKGFVAISGPIGAGKTTILRALLRRIGRSQNVCFLSQPELEVSELLGAILHGFGVETRGLEGVELRRKLREVLEESDKPGILIVDEAHLLTVEALEQIRLLSNLEEENRKLLQIVLSGQPELNDLLSRPRLHPLTQRIEMFYEIEPLGPEETQAYIERRIRVAGSANGPIFEPEAIEAIHYRSGGIPRLINILADRCLITAFVDETRHVTKKVVREAYDDLGEVTQSVMRGGGRKVRPSRTVSGRTRSEAESLSTPAPRLQPAKPAPPTRAPAPAPAPVQKERPAEWREPYLSGRKPKKERAPRPRRKARAQSPADRWLAVVGIVALAVMAILSLGSRGFPVIFASTGEVSRPAPPPDTALLPDEFGEAPAEAEEGAPSYAIHVASFRVLSRAETLATTLRGKIRESVRISPSESETGLWYRVLVGDFATRGDAIDRMANLRDRHGFTFLRPVRLGNPEDHDGLSRTDS